jgi:hypothetical protein
MRIFHIYRVEIREVKETLDNDWGHLNKLAKGYRSKNFSVPPLAGLGPYWGDFFKIPRR